MSTADIRRVSCHDLNCNLRNLFKNLKFQPYHVSTWLNWQAVSTSPSHVHWRHPFSACRSQLLFYCFSKTRWRSRPSQHRWALVVYSWCLCIVKSCKRPLGGVFLYVCGVQCAHVCVRPWPCLLQRPLSNEHKAFLVNDSPSYPYDSPLARRGRTAATSANELQARGGSASGPK